MKQYKLLKDLPNLKAGAIFSYDEKVNGYVHQSDSMSLAGFDAYIVEGNTDWFSLLSDDEPVNPCAWWHRNEIPNDR